MRDGRPPCPYAGDDTSHTAEFLRHPHYNETSPFLQGEIFHGLVCCIGLCRDYPTLHSSFVRPGRSAQGAGRGIPPLGNAGGAAACRSIGIVWQRQPLFDSSIIEKKEQLP